MGENGVQSNKIITVIIPNYNGMRYLPDCMESLDAQLPDTVPFEVLVVDNGSRDGSVEWLEERHPAARILRLSENTGFCHAVNTGIEASQAPYIILLNNDTKPAPGFIRSLYEAIRADSRLFSVSARMRMWDRPELLDGAGDQYCALGWAYARGKGRPARRYDRPGEVFSACGGAAIYRREILAEIGLFDELHFAYLEDLDIGYRARIHGYRNAYAPGAEVLHYGSAATGSRYNPRKTALSSANSVYVIYKNMPLFQLIWNLPFLIFGFLVKALFFAGKGMGAEYRKGLRDGVKRCASPEGRSRKIRFAWRNFFHYLRIQMLLYRNLLALLGR